MAQIVAAMAMTHSPGLTGWFERAPEEHQKHALRATAEMRERLIAARPDVIVAFSNDHLLNWPINNTPEYTVGIGAEHVGPADWYDEWLGMATKYRIPGHPELARFIVNESVRRRLALAYLRTMEFDDGISVPMHFLNPEGTIPLVPVTMNCTVPPVQTPERSYQVGAILRDVVKAFPGNERVAVVATGGLSHEPGGPLFLGGRGVRSLVPRSAQARRPRSAAARVHAREDGGGRLRRHRRAERLGPRHGVHARPRRRAGLHAGGGLAQRHRHGRVERAGLIADGRPSGVGRGVAAHDAGRDLRHARLVRVGDHRSP